MSLVRPTEVPLGYGNPYSPWYKLRSMHDVKENRLPRQCAHWLAMTEEDHALSQPPHHSVALDANASKTFPSGEGVSACADGRGKSNNTACRPGWFRYFAFPAQSSSADYRRHLPQGGRSYQASYPAAVSILNIQYSVLFPNPQTTSQVIQFSPTPNGQI